MHSRIDIKSTFKILFFSILLIFAASCEQTDTESTTIDGNWKCKESHPVHGEQSYYVSIEYDKADSSKIYIYNFLGLENTPTSKIYAIGQIQGDEIIIQRQEIANAQEVQGRGNISTDFKTIYWDYNHIQYGEEVFKVTATYTLAE